MAVIKKELMLDTLITVLRTLFLKLVLASEYSSHFENKPCQTLVLYIQLLCIVS